jgi:hypothetical protein
MPLTPVTYLFRVVASARSGMSIGLRVLKESLSDRPKGFTDESE